MNEGADQVAPRPAASEAEFAAVRGLGRALALSALYPPGHPRITELLEHVAESCRACDRSAGLVLEVAQNALTARSRPLPMADREVARVHGALHGLAIAALHVEPAVTADDLQLFASVVLAERAQLARSRGFSQVDVHDRMPATIRVAHRSFGSQHGDRDTASLIDRARDAVLMQLETLAAEGDLEDVAQLVTVLVSHIVERIEYDSAKLVDPAVRGRSLDSVLELCAHAMKHALEQVLGQGGSLGDLDKLVASIEKAVALSQDKQSVEVMMDVLRLASDQIDELQRLAQERDEQGCELSLEQLRTELGLLYDDCEPLAEPRGPDAEEQLTLLMFMVGLEPERLLARIGAALRSCDRSRWARREARILAHGLADFASREPAAVVDRFLPLAMEAARACRGDLLRNFLLPVCRRAETAEAQALLWPHVVNELLRAARTRAGSDRAHAAALEELWAVLAAGRALAGAEHRGLERLLRLDAVREGSIPKGLFEDGHPELRNVIAVLLDAPIGGAIGRQLFEELRAGPPRWPAFEAVHALPRYDSQAQMLVQHALWAGADAAHSQQLVAQSARILMATLPHLARERRREPWVPAALMALGELGVAGADRVLAAVLRRRFGLFPQWPANCRQAARLALGQLLAQNTRPE